MRIEQVMNIPRKVIKGLILLVVVGLSAVLVVGVWRGNMNKEQQSAAVAEKTDAEMKLTDMEYTEMQQGKKFWTLLAAEARYFQDQQESLLKSVRLTFFLHDGEELHLESQEGILHAGTKNIELWNTVKVILPRGYEVVTERAAYDHQQKKVYSETMLTLSGPDVHLQGNRWEYNIPEHRAVLEGGVRASLVYLPENGKPDSARP